MFAIMKWAGEEIGKAINKEIKKENQNHMYKNLCENARLYLQFNKKLFVIHPFYIRYIHNNTKEPLFLLLHGLHGWCMRTRKKTKLASKITTNKKKMINGNMSNADEVHTFKWNEYFESEMK